MKTRITIFDTGILESCVFLVIISAAICMQILGQNYILIIASSAGLSAARCGFIAIATMFIFGLNDPIIPIAIGALISVVLIFLIHNYF